MLGIAIAIVVQAGMCLFLVCLVLGVIQGRKDKAKKP